MKYLFLILLVLTTSLYGEKEPIYISYVRKLQQFYAAEVHKSGLQLMSIGGCLMNDVEKISLGFYIDKNVNVDEARRLYIRFAEPFRKMINADRKIRPYLRNYPVTINDLKFSLSFRDDNQRSNTPFVENVFHANGKICYYTRNSTVILRETYEEALKIVQVEQQTFPTPFNDPEEIKKIIKNY